MPHLPGLNLAPLDILYATALFFPDEARGWAYWVAAARYHRHHSWPARRVRPWPLSPLWRRPAPVVGKSWAAP